MDTVKFYAYEGKSLISWIIRFRTLSKYSHIAIGIDEYIYEAWEGRGIKGVVRSKSPYTHHKPGTIVHSIVVPCRHKSEFKVFLEGQVGKKYDWIGVLSLGLNRNKDDKSKWFCSELANEFFRFEFEDKFLDDKSLVTPEKFWTKIKNYVLGLENSFN